MEKPKFVVWNADAAKLETPKPVFRDDAYRLADGLERVHGDTYFVFEQLS